MSENNPLSPIDPKLARQIYNELASDASKEASGFIVDVVKTGRLLTYFPFRFCALMFHRLQDRMQDAKSRVPEDRQVGASPAIAMPVLERLAYEEDDSILKEMYVNLLARAIDKERQDEAHPAFVRIIEQLSPDEAFLLYYLHNRPEGVFYGERDVSTGSILGMRESYGLPKALGDRLTHSRMFEVSLAHLWGLSLVFYKQVGVKSEEPYDLQQLLWRLSRFGTLFAKACIPQDVDLNLAM